MRTVLVCLKVGVVWALTLAVASASVVAGGQWKVKRHETAGVVELVPGAERGTIKQPLLMGKIVSSMEQAEQKVYFVITDASDKDFAEMFGTVRADSLEEAPDAAVEAAIFDRGEWTFFNDPGLVSHFEGDEAKGPVANPDYSPLKRIIWDGKVVTVNVPFVKWGDGPGQQLLVDQGGCDPLCRSTPPRLSSWEMGPRTERIVPSKGPWTDTKGGRRWLSTSRA